MREHERPIFVLEVLIEADACWRLVTGASRASPCGSRRKSSPSSSIEPGDVIIVTRLDRLARSTRDLLNVLDEVAKRQAGFRSLKDSWADTTTLMLTVLGGLAEFERELIRARTGEGRKRAQASGVQFGRPPKLTAHQRQEPLQRLNAGETLADIAKTYVVDPTTIGRLRPFGEVSARPLKRGRRKSKP